MAERKTYKYKTLRTLVQRLRSDLKDQDFVILFAHNGTGKTRLSMEFKEAGKRKRGVSRDTLYFNAFTEDLFTWENDIESNEERYLKINSDSRFFDGFKELALEDKIFNYYVRYSKIDFKIDYENWKITFSRNVIKEVRNGSTVTEKNKKIDNIKISRGEENIFIWCIYLAILELVIDESESYDWVKYLYIDDPISSLDDNNAIVVASDLAKLLKKGKEEVKAVVSTHHSLFFNVMCNELNKNKHKKYYVTCDSDKDSFILRKTNETPFFHHVSMIHKLKKASEKNELYTYHFNILRSILEKTAVFFGFDDFSKCIHGVEDEVLFARALNLLSHGKYSIYEPIEMIQDTKDLFTRILDEFLDKYEFSLPE